MKTLLLSMLLLPAFAQATVCEVDGISDSPQRLSCYINHGKLIKKLMMNCHEGKYALNWEGQKFLIDTAYHEDVESGSSPLVFVSGALSLTVVEYKLYHRAELVIAEKSYDGLCFDK